MYHFGEVVLLEYPYSDLSGVKLRPAVVIRDTNDNDFILARITSQKGQSQYDMVIDYWQSAGLLRPSVIRVHKLVTLETYLVKRTMGKLSERDLNKLSDTLKNLFSI